VPIAGFPFTVAVAIAVVILVSVMLLFFTYLRKEKRAINCRNNPKKMRTEFMLNAIFK
jgi:hypothetical protein